MCCFYQHIHQIKTHITTPDQELLLCVFLIYKYKKGDKMEKVINLPTLLSEETIITKALESHEKEFNDFSSFKGTEMFDKLLGIYKPKTSKKPKKSQDKLPHPEPENAVEDESYTYNKNLKTYGQYFADGVNESVYKTLKTFICSNTYFAAAFLKSKGNYTSCLAFAIHKFIPDDVSDASSKTVKSNFYSLSDYEVYTEAVKYYFAGSHIDLKMEVINPEGFNEITVTEEDIKDNPDYIYALNLANAQLEAKKKKDEEIKRAIEENKQKRKEAAEKKKKKETEKKKADELKKSQQSLFTGGDSIIEEPKAKEIKIEPKSTTKSAFILDNPERNNDKGVDDNKIFTMSLI